MKNLQKIVFGLLSRENVFGLLLGISLVASLAVFSHFGRERVRGSHEQTVFFDPPFHNFGTTLQASVVHHNFKLVNRSTNEMRIVALRTSCSCTIAAQGLAGKLIRPHDALLIPVEFDSGARDGVTSSSITVLLEDKSAKYVAQAELRGDVTADFTMEPVAVDFGNVKPGEEVVRTVVFRPKALKDLVIRENRSPRKEFEISLKQGIREDSIDGFPKVFITLHAPQTTRHESLNEALQIATSSPRIPVVIIPIRAVVIPDIEVTPAVLVLPSNGASVDNWIRIRTAQFSRIAGVTGETIDGPKELDADGGDKDMPGGWSLTHQCRVPASMLGIAKEVKVELEVRIGTDRTEARTVSVQIKGLGQKERL